MRLPTVSDTLAVTTFRLAGVSDIDRMVVLFQMFFAESVLPTYGLEYDPKAMHDWLEDAIETGRLPHIIAIDNETGAVVGSIAYALSRQYTSRPIAEMDKFYVLPSWRGSAIGNLLLTFAIDAAKGDGAAVLRAGVSSGLKASHNLFRKFGFVETPHSILFVKEL